MLTHVRPEVPTETARLARSVFSDRNLYLLIGDRLCSLTTEFGGAPCCESDSLGVQSAHLLAIVTIFQFIEMLTDRQAREALRHRLDWKYALHLPAAFPSVPHLQTCEFRQNLLADPKHMAEFASLLRRMKAVGVFGANSKLQTDELSKGALLEKTSPETIVAAVCKLNQLDRLVDVIAAGIEFFAAYQTTWLANSMKPHWYTRYSPDSSIRHLPVSPAEWPGHFEKIGRDGQDLLNAVLASPRSVTGPNSPGSAHITIPLERELDNLFERSDCHFRYRPTSCRECGLNPLSNIPPTPF